MMILVLRVRSI